MRSIAALVLSSVVLLLTSSTASAGFVVNGTFAAGLSGWTTADPYGGTGLASPTVSSGVVTFQESPDSSLVQLIQTLSPTPGYQQTELRFEFRMTVPPGTVGAVAFPPDSFQATLYRSDLTTIAPIDNVFFPGFFSVDSSDSGAGPNYHTDRVTVTSLDDGWQRVSLNLSGLTLPSGTQLEFYLNGGDDGRFTMVELRNVEGVEVGSPPVSAVPAPSGLVLIATGIGCLFLRRLRR